MMIISTDNSYDDESSTCDKSNTITVDNNHNCNDNNDRISKSTIQIKCDDNGRNKSNGNSSNKDDNANVENSE